MSATRKPAPSEVGAGVRLCSFNGHAPAVARFILSDGCFGRENDREQFLCMQHVITAEPIGTMQMVEILDENWRDNLLSRWKLSGAPLQPGATQPEHDGVAHETKALEVPSEPICYARVNACELPRNHSGPCQKFFSQAQLTTLLERMARLVVEEAAKRLCQYCAAGNGHFPDSSGRYSCGAGQLHTLLTPEKLLQLREAVERP